MRVTTCDNCEIVLQEETNEVSIYSKTMFTITEKPGVSPYNHNVMFMGEKPKNLVKHFCSKECIGRYYSKHVKPYHSHNVETPNAE